MTSILVMLGMFEDDVMVKGDNDSDDDGVI